jgi:hypothetical protein
MTLIYSQIHGFVKKEPDLFRFQLHRHYDAIS